MGKHTIAYDSNVAPDPRLDEGYTPKTNVRYIVHKGKPWSDRMIAYFHGWDMDTFHRRLRKFSREFMVRRSRLSKDSAYGVRASNEDRLKKLCIDGREVYLVTVYFLMVQGGMPDRGYTVFSRNHHNTRVRMQKAGEIPTDEQVVERLLSRKYGTSILTRIKNWSDKELAAQNVQYARGLKQHKLDIITPADDNPAEWAVNRWEECARADPKMLHLVDPSVLEPFGLDNETHTLHAVAQQWQDKDRQLMLSRDEILRLQEAYRALEVENKRLLAELARYQ